MNNRSSVIRKEWSFRSRVKIESAAHSQSTEKMKLEEFNVLKEECLKAGSLVPQITADQYKSDKHVHLATGFVIKKGRVQLCPHVQLTNIINSAKKKSSVRCRIPDSADRTEFKFKDYMFGTFLGKFSSGEELSALDNIYTNHFVNGLPFIDEELFGCSFNQFIPDEEILQQYKQVLFVHSGCFTTLHMDPAETSLQVVLQGKKDFVFIDPKCKVINSSKSFKVEQLIPYATYLHLEQDDVFVIPASAAHAVYTHDSSIVLTQDYTSVHTIYQANIAAVKDYRKYRVRYVSQKIYFSLKIFGLLNISKLFNITDAQLWYDLIQEVMYVLRINLIDATRRCSEFITEDMSIVRNRVMASVVKILPTDTVEPVNNMQVTVDGMVCTVDKKAFGACFASYVKNKEYRCLWCDQHITHRTVERSRILVAEHAEGQSYSLT